MPFAQTKIVWGFVEESGNRVENCRVFIQKNGTSIESITNNNGFYQLNLGNLPFAFADGDSVLVEGILNSFYGSSSVVSAQGTTTQQVPTIQLQSDTVAPNFTLISPLSFATSNTPNIAIEILDAMSGPDISTLNLMFNSDIVVVNGMLANNAYTFSAIPVTNNRIDISLANNNPLPEGTTVLQSGSVSDKIGNSGTLSASFRIDTKAPTVSSILPTNSSFVTDPSSSILISFTEAVSGIDPSSIVMTVSGTDYSIISPEITFSNNQLTFTPSIPYVNTSVVSWSVYCKDFAQNHSIPFSACFAVFAEHAIFLNEKPAPYANSLRPMIQIGFIAGTADLDLTTFQMKIGNMVVTYGDPRLTLSSTSAIFAPDFDVANPEFLTVKITDLLGIQSSFSWTFSVDTTAPVIEIVYPISGGFVKSDTADLSFKIIDTESGVDPSSLRVNVNGQLYLFDDPEINYGSGFLAFIPSVAFDNDNENVVSIEVSDFAGNSAIPFTTTFYVDNEGPELLSVLPESSSGIPNLTPPIFIRIRDNKSGIDPSTIRITVNDRIFTPNSPGYSFDGELISILSAGLFSLSDHVSVRLYVKDFAGNITNQVISTFTFDTSSLQVVSVSPAKNTFLPTLVDSLDLTFDKHLDPASFTDISVILETQDLIQNNAAFEQEAIYISVDEEFLSVTPAIGFSKNKRYRLSLKSSVHAISGQFMAFTPPLTDGIIYQTEFTLYQAGDTLTRGTISVADLLNYLRGLEDCQKPIVSDIPELSDLNGDGLVDTQDISIIQAIIFGEKTLADIVVAGSKIVRITPPLPLIGSVPVLSLSDPNTAGLGNKINLDLNMPGSNRIAAIQVDILFGANTLLLTDFEPLSVFDFFKFKIMEPGKIRVIIADTDGSIGESLARLEFLVIGNAATPITLEAIEILDQNQTFVDAVSIQNTTFTPNSTKLIESISVVPEHLAVPADVRDINITAKLLDINGVVVQAESIPLEWTVIGNGFVFQTYTTTNEFGESSNFLRLSGPIGSQTEVRVNVRFDPSAYGLSPHIKIFDNRAVSLRLYAPNYSVGTGDPIQFRAFVNTIDGSEFETRDISWTTESLDAIVSPTGEFVGLKTGQYRVKAALNSNPNISILSYVITVTSILELFDCNDQPLLLDGITGIGKLDLGKIFSGNQSGTQEIRLRNVLKREKYTAINEILIKNGDPFPAILTFETEFSPIVKDSVKLIKRTRDGHIQKIPLSIGEFEITLPVILAETSGISTVFLPHVNVSQVGVFSCPPPKCSGPSAAAAFLTQKDTMGDLIAAGDFYIDAPAGRIYVRTAVDRTSPGRISYKYSAAATIDFATGAINITEPIFYPDDSIQTSYNFYGGTLENVSLSVVDGPKSDVLISTNGVTFAKTAQWTKMIPDDVARVYVRAFTSTASQTGFQSAELVIEADVVSVSSCF